METLSPSWLQALLRPMIIAATNLTWFCHIARWMTQAAQLAYNIWTVSMNELGVNFPFVRPLSSDRIWLVHPLLLPISSKNIVAPERDVPARGCFATICDPLFYKGALEFRSLRRVAALRCTLPFI
jgi:hypothetical protein